MEQIALDFLVRLFTEIGVPAVIEFVKWLFDSAAGDHIQFAAAIPIFLKASPRQGIPI